MSKDKYLFNGVFCLTGDDGADRGDFVFNAGRFSIGDNTPENRNHYKSSVIHFHLLLRLASGLLDICCFLCKISSLSDLLLPPAMTQLTECVGWMDQVPLVFGKTMGPDQ